MGRRTPKATITLFKDGAKGWQSRIECGGRTFIGVEDYDSSKRCAEAASDFVADLCGAAEADAIKLPSVGKPEGA